MLEFYGSTEGNAVLVNFDFKAGADRPHPQPGRPRAFRWRWSPTTSTPTRIRATPPASAAPAAPDEVGELLAEIRDDPRYPAARFDGYADSAATDAKMLRDVFKPGDAWFRTGDLMRRDARGYYYFVDRIGDTFRWKGENVSTTEVAETITTFPGVHEAIVYGVAAPGYEGRAGMAALVVGRYRGFDLAACARISKPPCPPTPGRCSCASAPNSRRPARSSRRRARWSPRASIPRASSEPLLFRRPRRAAPIAASTPRCSRTIVCGARRCERASASRARAERFVSLAELEAAAPEWADLCARAAEPNPFAEPGFLLPLLAYERPRRLALARWCARTAG